MPTGLTYAQYVAQVALLAVVDPNDPNYQANLPFAIDYAELMIEQDLDLLSTVSSLTGLSTTANKRSVNLGANPLLPLIVTAQQFNIITPVGQSNPDLGTRNPCLPVTMERLNFEWPDVRGATIPTMFAPLNQSTVLFGPWPDQNYSLELIGTIRPAPLSAANTTTFISLNLPNLMIAASMIYISGYQRNFGRQNDDPQMAVSWKSEYNDAKVRAIAEEARKKFQAAAWTSMAQAPVATPTRG
jgi:hypothetical protein